MVVVTVTLGRTQTHVLVGQGTVEVTVVVCPVQVCTSGGQVVKVTVVCSVVVTVLVVLV